MAAQIPAALAAFQGGARPGKLKITGVEILKLEGHQDAFTGVDKQYQVNPLHIYEDLRPKPYADSANPKALSIKKRPSLSINRSRPF
jgi:hypothetical protein